jgi:hypothetical protein
MNLFRCLLLCTAISGTSLHAATITQTDDFIGKSLDFTTTLPYSKFPGTGAPAGDTLTGVTILLNYTLAITNTLLNSGSSAQNATYEFTNTVNFQDNVSVAAGHATFAIGPTTYLLASGASVTVINNTATFSPTPLSSTSLPGLLTAYNDNSGNVTFTLSTLTSASVTGGVAITTNNASMSGSLAVIYTYSPPASTPSSLGIAMYSNQPVLFYPAAGNGGYVLQMNTNLATTNWVTVSNTVAMIAVLVTNTPKSAFFRLH